MHQDKRKIVAATIGPMPRPLSAGLAGAFDPMPDVTVTFEDGEVKTLFNYYPDELSFTASEFIGLTECEAHSLRQQKDIEYLTLVEISPDEAIAILEKLKGSNVYLRTRFAANGDSSLGPLRVSTEAILEEVDEHHLRFTWSPNGHLYLSLDDATFEYRDAEETALIGLQIQLTDGTRCMIRPLG